MECTTRECCYSTVNNHFQEKMQYNIFDRLDTVMADTCHRGEDTTRIDYFPTNYYWSITGGLDLFLAQIFPVFS